MRLPCPSHTREAVPAPAWYNGLKTLIQVAAFWGFFLFLVPALVVAMETRWGVPRFDPAWGRVPAVAVFCLAGAVGLYCGALFVIHGRGTPLPLDTTTRLVILGPYRHIRNPMAVLGILQGVMVGVYLGSWGTMAYALCGIPAWNTLARPWEEADLARRFGSDYEHYRDSVPCWIPRLRAYATRVPARDR